MIDFTIPVGEGAAAAAAAEAPGASVDALGRSDFLRMLVAQLENQDPLNPQDGTEFTAQLAQFSSLEQLIAMRTAVDSLTASQDAGRVGSLSLAAVGMIGREALIEAESFEVTGDRLPPLALDLDQAVDSISVDVLDENGRRVAHWSAGATGAGRLDLANVDFERVGAGLADGVHRLRVEALANRVAQPAIALVRGRVTATTLAGDEPLVHVGPAAVPLARVREVFEAGSE